MDTQIPIHELALTQLVESEQNVRQHFDKNQLQELSQSMEGTGVLVPLLVRPLSSGKIEGGKFEIVDGARRFRAAKLAKLKEVPCIIRLMSDPEALEAQITANDQRADVHRLEQAFGYKKLQEANPSLTVEAIATKMGRSPSYVYQTIKLAELIPSLQKMFLADVFTYAHAILCARLQPKQQETVEGWFKERIKNKFMGQMSVRDLSATIARDFHLKLADAPFDTKDAALVPAAGSCVECPKRTGANKLLFSDIAEGDTCTDPPCYQSKVAALVQISLDAHPEAKKLTVGAYGTKSKGLRVWRIAGAKKCKDTTEGVVVEVMGYADKTAQGKPGQVLQVCVRPECTTHFPNESAGASDYNSRTGGSRRAEKARKLELKRRALVFAAIGAKAYAITAVRERETLNFVVSKLSHDNAKALCDAMGWTPTKKAEHGMHDWDGIIKRRMAEVPAAAVPLWTHRLIIAEDELWYSFHSTAPPKLLDAAARDLKVPLAVLAKRAKMTKRELAKLDAPKVKKARTPRQTARVKGGRRVRRAKSK